MHLRFKIKKIKIVRTWPWWTLNVTPCAAWSGGGTARASCSRDAPETATSRMTGNIEVATAAGAAVMADAQQNLQ